LPMKRLRNVPVVGEVGPAVSPAVESFQNGRVSAQVALITAVATSEVRSLSFSSPELLRRDGFLALGGLNPPPLLILVEIVAASGSLSSMPRLEFEPAGLER
jgi:hypothetical protein